MQSSIKIKHIIRQNNTRLVLYLKHRVHSRIYDMATAPLDLD